VGSGQLPAGLSRAAVDQAYTSVLNEGMCCFPSSRTGSEISSDEHIAPFMITSPPFSIIKRIRRDARYKASEVFTSCLRDVIHNGSTANWEHLLNFARAQRQPSGGGRRFNLTVQILAQLKLNHFNNLNHSIQVMSFQPHHQFHSIDS